MKIFLDLDVFFKIFLNLFCKVKKTGKGLGFVCMSQD